MVKTKLTNNKPVDELQQIMTHIKNGDNFLLSGGAGSGKTYTLVQVIKQIIEENPEVPLPFIQDILVGKEQIKAGQGTPYVFGEGE